MKFGVENNGKKKKKKKKDGKRICASSYVLVGAVT
jgi:hypothetical protein